MVEPVVLRARTRSPMGSSSSGAWKGAAWRAIKEGRRRARDGAPTKELAAAADGAAASDPKKEEGAGWRSLVVVLHSEHFVLLGVEESRRLRPGRGPATVFPMGHVDAVESRAKPQQELAARAYLRATGDAFRLAATVGRFGEDAKDWAFHFETGGSIVLFKACEGPKAPERRRAWRKKCSGKRPRVQARWVPKADLRAALGKAQDPGGHGKASLFAGAPLYTYTLALLQQAPVRKYLAI